MALPPLPLNNTARYFIDYTTGRKDHSLIVRVGPASAPAQVDQAVFSILGTLQQVLPQNWRVTGARFQNARTEFTLPASLPLTEGLVGTSGDFLLPHNEEPRQVTFTGRSSTTGRKTRFGIFGVNFITPATYRATPEGISGRVGAVLSLLGPFSQDGYFVAIDGSPVLWNQYANVNYNSYWETEARG